MGWGSAMQGSWRLGVRWGVARGQLETKVMVRAQESDRSDRLHLLYVFGSFIVSET